jgi:hypothetical protein
VGLKTTGLAAGDGAYDQEGFGAGDDRVGEGHVGRFVGKIFGAGEEAEERAAFLGDVIANGAAEHGIRGFECVQGGTESDGSRDVELELAGNPSEIAEMRRKNHANHEKPRFESNKERSKKFKV